MLKYEKKLDLATKLINDTLTVEEFRRFLTIFPFTNVNIAGYFPMFDFVDKSFLTIGSSCDPIINAAYLGCTEQTLIDINPFTKEYFWLKKSSLMALDRNEFKDYFCYRNYFPHCYDNRNALNPDSFEKVIPYLRKFDYESYLFWRNLFSKYKGEHIRRKLFTFDEENGNVLEKTNLYLKDNDSYIKAREAMKSVIPKIIESDIYEYDDFGSYDNINLANLAQFAKTPDDLVNFKRLVDKLAGQLNIDGTMLVAYLFDTVIDTPYNNNYPIIFNLPVSMELLKEYASAFVTFISPPGILWEDDRQPDSAIVFKKTNAKRKAINTLK